MKNYYFTEEHELFRQGLKDFLAKEVSPFIDTWEEQGKIPRDVIKKFGDMGYLGLNYPEKYGGIDVDFFFSVVFIEEILLMIFIIEYLYKENGLNYLNIYPEKILTNIKKLYPIFKKPVVYWAVVTSNTLHILLTFHKQMLWLRWL